MIRLSRASWAAAFVLLAACSDGPSPPPPIKGGPVRLVLQAPQFDIGAVLIRVNGPVDSVTAPTGYVLSRAPFGVSAQRIVVAGNVANGDLVTLWIPDLEQVGIYSTFVEQAASRLTYALYDPSGFSLLLVK
ncbi:MAG: hypothetical protein AAB075_03325 [Gemmatimonadota bacterium]